MLCEIEKNNDQKDHLKKLPSRGSASAEVVRVITFECAMVMTTFGAQGFCYVQCLSSLAYGITELLKAMNYTTDFDPSKIDRWFNYPEWKVLSLACGQDGE